MKRSSIFRRLTALAILAALPGFTAPAPPPKPELPVKAREILPLDQVKKGMKGYCMTVFSGDTIEPFPVEVISVARDFAPQKGVIWMRSDDPRMAVSGPVAGMSGSPVYLWSEGEEQKLGQGGKLIGAFAYGFSGIKVCYFGVQPIEQMRAVADNVGKNDTPRAAAGADHRPYTSLRTFMKQGGGADQSWRARAIAGVLMNDGKAKASDKEAERSGNSLSGPEGVNGTPYAMPLPVSVGSAGLAKMWAPMFEPLGLMPVAAATGVVAGKPPPDLDPEKIPLKPGSAISIPLAFGDLDISAQGTVTDVLPNGKLLAFGHPMFGAGPAAIPMASGYVHYVVPHLARSFKLGGSGVIRGTIVRDETSAIAGVWEKKWTSAPITITVEMPDVAAKTYHYEVVHERDLTAYITAMLIVESITGERGLPKEPTVHLKGAIKFAGNRKVEIDSFIPGASERAIAGEIVPAIAALYDNPFEIVPLESVELTVKAEPVIRSATITAIRLDRTETAPGDKLGMTVRFQPFGKKAFDQRFEFAVPADLPDGDYQLIIADASTYSDLDMQSKPYLGQIQNVDNILEVVKRVTSVRSDALYLVMQKPVSNLAVGRNEMPELPSSKRALITGAAETGAQAYTDLIVQTVKLDFAPSGRMAFAFSVRKDLKKN